MLGVGEDVSLGVGVGVSLGLGEGDGVGRFFRLLLFGDGLGVTEGEGGGELFLRFARCGVGVGLTKISLIFLPNDG